MTLFARLALRVSGTAPLLRPRAAARFAPALPLQGGLVAAGSAPHAGAPARSAGDAAASAAQPVGPMRHAMVAEPALSAPQDPGAAPWRALGSEAAVIRRQSAAPPRQRAPGGPRVDVAIHSVSAAPPATVTAAEGARTDVASDPAGPVPSPMASASVPEAPYPPIELASKTAVDAGSVPDLRTPLPLAVSPAVPGRGRPDLIATSPAEPATVVEVRIGAIEVHTPPPAAPSAGGESRLMSLDAYLTRERRR